MECRMAECFIAAIVESCRSHFTKCRAIPFEQTRTPIVPAGNYWRTGTRPSARTSLRDLRLYYFNFWLQLCLLLLASLFPLSQGLYAGTEGKQGSQRGLQRTPVCCKWNNAAGGGLSWLKNGNCINWGAKVCNDTKKAGKRQAFVPYTILIFLILLEWNASGDVHLM